MTASLTKNTPTSESCQLWEYGVTDCKNTPTSESCQLWECGVTDCKNTPTSESCQLWECGVTDYKNAPTSESCQLWECGVTDYKNAPTSESCQLWEYGVRTHPPRRVVSSESAVLPTFQYAQLTWRSAVIIVDHEQSPVYEEHAGRLYTALCCKHHTSWQHSSPHVSPRNAVKL